MEVTFEAGQTSVEFTVAAINDNRSGIIVASLIAGDDYIVNQGAQPLVYIFDDDDPLPVVYTMSNPKTLMKVLTLRLTVKAASFFAGIW